MTEQQKIDIEKLTSIQEWDNYVEQNNITWANRVWDRELGNVLHKKRFKIFNEIIKKNGKLTLQNIGFGGEYHV